MTIWADRSKVSKQLVNALRKKGLSVHVISTGDPTPRAKDDQDRFFWNLHAILIHFDLDFAEVLAP